MIVQNGNDSQNMMQQKSRITYRPERKDRNSSKVLSTLLPQPKVLLHY